MQNEFRSGFVTIVGKPNVGKSTLMNALVGEKISIVTNRPQTTRNRIMGVLSKDNYQMVFLDTPGIHKPKTKLGEFMNKSINDAMKGMDALIVVVDSSFIKENDLEIVENMSKSNVFKVLILNKIDLIEKSEILNIINKFSEYRYDAILPISARKGDGLKELENLLLSKLPEGPQYFPDDMITDQPERVICAEIIREKALLFLQEEIPHGIGVDILKISNIREDLVEIHADLYCEKNSHKSIIIGKNGSMLGKIGKSARLDIENLLGNRVNLKLWVKVREGWRNRGSDLFNLGYTEKS